MSFSFSTSAFLLQFVYIFLMALRMDGDSLNICLFLFVTFLFGLPLILDNLQAFVLRDSRSNVCFEVWSHVTCLFT